MCALIGSTALGTFEILRSLLLILLFIIYYYLLLLFIIIIIYYYYLLLYLKSITVPLQGFLNAIVYGWTRKDFVKAVDNSLSYRVPPPLVPPKPRRSLLFRRKQQQEQEQEKVGESYAQESSQLLNSPRRTQDRERRNLRDHLNVLSDNSDSDGSL